MANTLISPGIQTKIIDLNNYLTAVPGTIGFVPIITEKGKDNELVRVTSYPDYAENFGEPDMRIFGKYYGCGPYVAAQHLSVSNDLYVVRALPDDATYSHAYIYFSEVDDYPYNFMFAKRYADQILDPKETVKTDLYKVADGSAACMNLDKRSQAIAASAAYDADMQPIDVIEAVVYTSDKAYAFPTSYTPLYDIDVNPDAEPPVDKRADAIAAGVAYGAEYKILDVDAEVGDAVYTSNPEFAAAGATANHYADDEYEVYERIGYIESKGSKYDNDVGYKKNHNDWYFGKHTSLSAFSVVPDMVYANQSDVVCYQQLSTNATAYAIDPSKKHIAFLRRVGFDSEGILVLDDESRIEYTTRTELAAETESGDPATIRVKAPVWEVDAEPWYYCNSSDPESVEKGDPEAAIRDYDGYDENGFLTNDPTKVVYCGNFSYADKDAEGNPRAEVKIALRKPATKKFVDNAKNMRFVFDRSNKAITVDGVSYTREQRARIAMENLAAWDKNGYPALSTDDVYVTSIEVFATTSKTPKMTNTQKLDGLFYGMDTCTLAAIRAQESSDIYSTDGRMPHECVLGYVRAVGRGSYYNDYSIKITSDANPQNFGTYKFQIFELQDGAEVLAESFNVSFDPSALDGDGESLYFVDVINKFSERVVVEANENAIDLFQKSIKDYYQNDPTIAETAAEETFTVNGVDVPLVGNYPAVVPTFDSDENSDTYDYILNADFEQAVQDVKDLLIATAETEAEKIAAQNYAVGVKGRLIWEAYYAKAWAEKYTHDAAKAYNEALALPNTDETKAAKVSNAISMMNDAEDMTSDASAMYTWATSGNLMNMKDSDPVTAGEQPFYLDNGSLGSLLDKKGNVNSTIGDQILCWAYNGLLKNPVIKKTIGTDGSIKYKQQYNDNVYDSDWIYFSLVYDPGYKPDVKDAARELVDTYRDDCFLVSDCTDNADCEDCLKYVGAVKGATDCRIWNTFRAGRFEPYSRIYDKYTGKDVWISPVYHMAQLFAKNDAQYGLQYASAGFQRAVVSSIKELRYSPNKGQRDLLYMAQVNPIVHFPEGMTVWGNLTTQKKASPLSDINSVRVVLYIKRALEQYLRNFIFELNESPTWETIDGAVSAFLSNCQASNMIEDFSTDVGATDYELKTKTCHVNVTITTKKTLEKIELNLFVQ